VKISFELIEFFSRAEKEVVIALYDISYYLVFDISLRDFVELFTIMAVFKISALVMI